MVSPARGVQYRCYTREFVSGEAELLTTTKLKNDGKPLDAI
jgi:hypothetical protein